MDPVRLPKLLLGNSRCLLGISKEIVGEKMRALVPEAKLYVNCGDVRAFDIRGAAVSMTGFPVLIASSSPLYYPIDFWIYRSGYFSTVCILFLVSLCVPVRPAKIAEVLLTSCMWSWRRFRTLEGALLPLTVTSLGIDFMMLTVDPAHVLQYAIM